MFENVIYEPRFRCTCLSTNGAREVRLRGLASEINASEVNMDRIGVRFPGIHQLQFILYFVGSVNLILRG